MAKRVQILGYSSAVLAVTLGRARELMVNLTNKSLHVMDGSTVGGYELARADLNNVNNATAVAAGKMSASDKSKLDGIESGATADQVAADVPYTPSGDVVATNVQAAITELDSDLTTEVNLTAAHRANTSNPHSVTKAQVGLTNVTDAAQLAIANDLSDLNDADTALANLGLSADAIAAVKSANNAAIIASLSALLADIAGATFAQGDIIYHNGSNLVKLAAGTAGQVLKTAGAGANPSWAWSGIVQHILKINNTLTNTTSVLPVDTSIPQISEGIEILSQSITAKSVSNKIVIDAFIPWTANSAQTGVAALFKDSDSDALTATASFVSTSGGFGLLHLHFEETPSDLSAHTYSVRFGGQGGTVYINGWSSDNYFAGVDNCKLIIEEIAV